MAELRVYDDEAQLYDERQGREADGMVRFPEFLVSPNATVQRRSARERPTPEALRDAGRALTEMLPADVQNRLAGTVAPAGALRVKVSAAGTLFDELPWEALLDPTVGRPRALAPNFHITRSVPVRFAPPPLDVPGRVKVLLVLTNPKDESPLNASREIGAVAHGMESPDYELRVLEGPTIRAFEADLQEFSPHVLHYIGHSGVNNGDGNLILHGPGGETDWLCASDLSRMLPLTVRLLCLSTCFTTPNYDPRGMPRFADAPASQMLPTTVLNRFGVEEDGDSVAAFWSAFYRQLVSSTGDVTQAMHAGRIACSDSSASDWASFSLVVRDNNAAGLRIGLGPSSEEEVGAQIRAQFASSFANRVAHQVLKLGGGASEVMRMTLDQASSEASEFLRKVK